MDVIKLDLIESAKRQIAAAKGVFLTIELDAPQSVALLGQLQLALRHPNNQGPSAARMRELAQSIEGGLKVLGPAVAELCAMGWQPEHDASPENEPAAKSPLIVQARG